MAQQLSADPLPLSRDDSGVIRIAGTRVSLDSLVVAYSAGSSIQEIAEGFPDLALSDIHASIAYYLRHQEEVETYLDERRRAAGEAAEKIRREFPKAYRTVRPA